jgi:capsular polysaccharide biosynthesis protein
MEEINLYDLMRFYARKWLTIATVVMIGAILGVIYTFFVQQPQYKSTATLLLVGTGRTSNQESVVLNNYVQLFESRRILEPVIAEQKYDATYDKLAANTSAENVKNTDIINVSISTTNPKTSKALLEAAILKFREEAKTLYGDGAIKINVVDAADAPIAPTNVKPIQQVGLAIVAAFALAIVALFFIYDYTTTQKTQTKAPTDVIVKAKAKVKTKAKSKKIK